MTNAVHPAAYQVPSNSRADWEGKLFDLSVLKPGARDFLSFVDETKEMLHAYLYHRTGSRAAAERLLTETYLRALGRALSWWWFGTLTSTYIIGLADRVVGEMRTQDAADIDPVYLPSLYWLPEDQRRGAASLHEALWTLGDTEQRLLTLSLLVGLSDEKISDLLDFPVEDVRTAVQKSRAELLSRWQPVAGLVARLGDLVFVPAFDLARENKLRTALIDKYNALRLRRTQWLVIGGLVAVMSNMIVAGVLAFAVVTQPTLGPQTKQVAGLDAVALQRLTEVSRMQDALASLYREGQNLARYQAARTVNTYGLAAARDALGGEQQHLDELDRVLTLLKKVQTAQGRADRFYGTLSPADVLLAQQPGGQEHLSR